MSKMRDKLRALHKPRPTEVPTPQPVAERLAAKSTEGTSDGSDIANSANSPHPQSAPELSDHRPLSPDEVRSARDSTPRPERPAKPTRAEQSRELPDRLSATDRRAPLPQKTVLGSPNTVTSRGMAAWRKRRAETGSGAPERAFERAPETETETERAPESRRKRVPNALASSAPHTTRTHQARPGSTALLGSTPRRTPKGTPDWHRAARHLSELTPGHVRIVDGCPIFVARRHYAGDIALAGRPLDDARHLPDDVLVALGVSPDAVLSFLDIESSGLSGQQGSVPFMVGIATWDAGGLLAEVITMHKPADERGALLLVASLLETVDAVVTFNGHVFDLPFLRHRFAAHELDASVLDLPHIDAYRVARKALTGRKGRGAFKLTQLEEDLLGIVREGDIPGSEAPPRWFQTQRDGEVERLLPLLEHNQHDIVTLPALLCALLAEDSASVQRREEMRGVASSDAAPAAAPAVKEPSPTGLDEHRGDPVALLRRGLTAFQEGRFPEAAAMLEAADLAGLTKQQRWSALKTLAQVQDALGQTLASERSWRTLSELPSTDPLPLTRLVEIARTRGDDDAADALVERAKQRAPWWREE
jgi:uncharacterized protein YprB with RNaseH-like and TPR domain